MKLGYVSDLFMSEISSVLLCICLTHDFGCKSVLGLKINGKSHDNQHPNFNYDGLGNVDGM